MPCRPALLAGETAALIGSSGVGKSTIVNRLLGGRAAAPPARFAPKTSRGRHTTTSSLELFRMPGGWLLIDMPGLREVQLWASAEHTRMPASTDIAELAAEHAGFATAPTRASRAAPVRAAGLDAGRLGNYRKMQRELDYLERKTDKRLMSETRATLESHPQGHAKASRSSEMVEATFAVH